MIKHSIRSVLRTPKKSILFLFLIIVLSLFLSIGAGMYEAANKMLNDADETFTTVVELIYLGDKDDNDKGFYNQMNKEIDNFDLVKPEQDSEVLTVNRENSALAYLNDKQINHNLSALNDYVIIEVFNVRPYDEMLYQATINKVHFGKTMRENTYVTINNIDELGQNLDYDFVYGHKYILIGKIFPSTNPTPKIMLQLPEGLDGFKPVIHLESSKEFYESEDGESLSKLAEAFNIVNKSLPVTLVSSLEASEPYFNRELTVSEGHTFRNEEYQEGNNQVILISRNLADFYEVELGDKLDLNLHYAKSGIGLSDYLKDYSFSKSASYEVVGIFDNKNEISFNIYMPMADWIKQDNHSLTIARYLVKNQSGKKFIEKYSKELPDNMSFALYDQGYEEAIRPILELRNTAVLLLILGCLSGTVILLLFSYLYVYKQGDTLKNMLSLGSGKPRVFTYILFGSNILVLIASSIGAFISSAIINNLTNNIFKNISALYDRDLRYSERILGMQLEYVARISVNYWVPVFVTLLMLIVSFILIFAITIYVINEEKFKRKKIKRKALKSARKVKNLKKLKVRKEQNVMFGGIRPIPLKFAMVSIFRNAGRSLIVPLLTLVLSVFLVFLCFLSNIQQEKRARVYDQIPVNAYLTTFKNETRDISGLSLQYDIYRLIDSEYSYRMNPINYTYGEFSGEYTSHQAQEERDKILRQSDYFKEMYLYSSIHYEYMGISKTKDGKQNKELAMTPNVRKHADAFGFDWFLEAIKRMSRLAYADDIRYTPDFFTSSNIEVEFLSGYDFDSLRMAGDLGMISRNQAIKEGINLGDTIRITAWTIYEKNAICSVIDIKVVGIYQESWRSDVIYLPWIMGYDHEYYVDFYYGDPEYKLWNELLPRNIRSATFTLKNTENLDYFREYLDKQGYSEAGKIKSIRRAVVIQDKNLEETIKTLDNFIRLMDILIPIMLIMFGLIGFIVSYLLIRHRLSELAIMSSMGTGKIHVFLSFFFEQVILFIIGLLPVIIFGIIFPEYFNYYKGSLGYYLISYLAGSSIALLVLGRTKLIDILFSKE